MSRHSSFKASETLLGIETNDRQFQRDQIYWHCFKASETLLGIETIHVHQKLVWLHRFKASETLLGIETQFSIILRSLHARFKASETLLGIETCHWKSTPRKSAALQSLWNPFRDWNVNNALYRCFVCGFKASETLLGIETRTVIALLIYFTSFKASETLLGIETSVSNWIPLALPCASKPLKPF